MGRGELPSGIRVTLAVFHSTGKLTAAKKSSRSIQLKRLELSGCTQIIKSQCCTHLGRPENLDHVTIIYILYKGNYNLSDPKLHCISI